MKNLKTHTNNIHPITSPSGPGLVPMLEGDGSDSAFTGAFIMLGNATLAFSHTALKDQLVSVWTMDGANCYHRIPATKGKTTHWVKKNQSLFFFHTHTHTNTCKSSPLPKANSHSSAANRVVFVARLSGCVSVLHHISRDGERKREREGAATRSFPLGYKAAHHWPARLVVRGM